jgi:hypothetical protein
MLTTPSHPPFASMVAATYTPKARQTRKSVCDPQRKAVADKQVRLADLDEQPAAGIGGRYRAMPTAERALARTKPEETRVERCLQCDLEVATVAASSVRPI